MIRALKTLRPKQWIKNFFVFLPLVFSVKLFDIPSLITSVTAFLSFCLISGAIYTLNDLFDLKEDQLHPIKRNRPIASGQLKKSSAWIIVALSASFSLLLALSINLNFAMVILSYVLLQVLYSSWLKHLVILDIFSVAAGFFLRVIGGALAIKVLISSWLIICTILLALFLSMTKRRHEFFALSGDARQHRPSLREYNPYLLDQMISVVTASTLMAYCLYTISDETIIKFGTRNLVLTTPFVLYGIFRYLYLVYQKDQGGIPEEIVLRDRPLLINILLWGIATAFILYFR